MRLEKAVVNEEGKGWALGPWNSSLGIAVGYAERGIDEPHFHKAICEIYLVARGWAEVRIEMETYRLEAGDVLVVEPGEAHTFMASSEDYFHFVVHTPGLSTEAARADKVSVARGRLGLA